MPVMAQGPLKAQLKISFSQTIFAMSAKVETLKPALSQISAIRAVRFLRPPAYSPKRIISMPL